MVEIQRRGAIQVPVLPVVFTSTTYCGGVGGKRGGHGGRRREGVKGWSHMRREEGATCPGVQRKKGWRPSRGGRGEGDRGRGGCNEGGSQQTPPPPGNAGNGRRAGGCSGDPPPPAPPPPGTLTPNPNPNVLRSGRGGAVGGGGKGSRFLFCDEGGEGKGSVKQGGERILRPSPELQLYLQTPPPTHKSAKGHTRPRQRLPPLEGELKNNKRGNFEREKY